MAWSTWPATATDGSGGMGLNGHSLVYLDPGTTGSGYALVGYCADPMGKLAPLNEETTFGKSTVGWDATIETKVINSAPNDMAMAAANRLGCMKVVGPYVTLELKNIFIQVALNKSMGNKTGQSNITVTAEYPALGAVAPVSTNPLFSTQSTATFLVVSS